MFWTIVGDSLCTRSRASSAVLTQQQTAAHIAMPLTPSPSCNQMKCYGGQCSRGAGSMLSKRPPAHSADGCRRRQWVLKAGTDGKGCVPALTTRRDGLLLAAGAAGLMLMTPGQVAAVQGLTAGRIPGLSPEPGEDGFYVYTRPEGKSGGHGVGWSEIPRYSFRVPAGWEETPVSIADLGGTEIDLRFASRNEGSLSVVVAPVLRFADVGFNADVRLEDLAPPDRIIAGFGPELFGKPLEEGDVLETEVVQRGGLTYYQYQVKPHELVTATAVRNRLFIMSVSASSRQFKKHGDDLLAIAKSFTVPI